MKLRNQKVIINSLFDLNKMAFLIMSDIVSYTVHFYVLTAGQIHFYESNLSVVHRCNSDLFRYAVE